MGQESGEIWTAETLLQPILPKSDRLLGVAFEGSNYGLNPMPKIYDVLDHILDCGPHSISSFMTHR